MSHSAAKKIAFGGIFAALATVIMSMGTLIPIATFVCPVLCMLILSFVTKFCGRRIGWAWYGAVSILAMLFSPDKEAALVFLFMGFYPILKQQLDRLKGSLLWKLLLFNGVVLLIYGLVIRLFGLTQIVNDYRTLGKIMSAVMLVIGNVIFLLLDRVLDRIRMIK